MTKPPPELVAADAETKAIAVRAYVPTQSGDIEANASGKDKPRRSRRGPSEYALVFDCETTTDASQRLRFGSYQFRKGDDLLDEGLFYHLNSLSEGEQRILRQYTSQHDLKIRTVQEFIDDVLFGTAYEWRASIIGFNLPFDISRLAIKRGSARGKAMKGGFTFTLSENRRWPNIQIKHLSSHAALMQFTKPPRWVETRSERTKFQKRPPKRGSFIDVHTLARALCSRPFSLASLSEFLKTEHRKSGSDDHGARLTKKYIDYCRNDVQVTWECYRALVEQFTKHGLKETQASKILSEASLGKAYLKEMGIRPFRDVQPDFPDALTGIILSTYFGGRSEVRWRRTVKQVLYCDFLSMYPTVFTLTGLWRFVIAQGVNWKESTRETRLFLEALGHSDLQSQETWKRLTTLVKVNPNADIFPVRAQYDCKAYTIGLNYLSSKQRLWYTLADAIASKLLTGKTPEILEAITFSPKAPQQGLKAIFIAGNRNYRIDPETSEFFKRIIDLRSTVKDRLRSATASARERLESEQLTLKILANATSYGIFVEVNVSELDKHERRDCFGPSGESFEVETDKAEEPGQCFYPLLATLITGGARLMLAIAETLIAGNGLEWAFCDTDSMAIARPEDMSQEAFLNKSKSVCDWSTPLNPYEKKGSLFKIEDHNYKIGSRDEFEPLYCFCVSAKRYVLFSRASEEIIIRKASAHGLGHLLAPYSEADALASIPKPRVSLDEVGVERWQYDLWYKITRAALDGHADEVDLSYHPALKNAAVSRYGATTPELLGWFKEWNKNRSYEDQVKPFNFLLCFQSAPNFWSSRFEPSARKRGRGPKGELPKPVAPFDKNLRKASRNAFDRITGRPVSTESLKTYRQALAQFHLSPEMKFLNGDYLDRRRTERRHVHATAIVHIGKEANKWQEQFFTGGDDAARIEYGPDTRLRELDELLRETCKQLGERETGRRLRIARMTLKKALTSGISALSAEGRRQIVGDLTCIRQTSSSILADTSTKAGGLSVEGKRPLK